MVEELVRVLAPQRERVEEERRALARARNFDTFPTSVSSVTKAPSLQTAKLSSSMAGTFAS